MQYMTRCPFSLSRLVKVTKTGQVIYKAEKDACRAFPGPQWEKGDWHHLPERPEGCCAQMVPVPFFRDALASGPKRNFQVLAPLDFLALRTARPHLPTSRGN
jgi:hypothetical protein